MSPTVTTTTHWQLPPLQHTTQCTHLPQPVAHLPPPTFTMSITQMMHQNASFEYIVLVFLYFFTHFLFLSVFVHLDHAQPLWPTWTINGQIMCQNALFGPRLCFLFFYLCYFLLIFLVVSHTCTINGLNNALIHIVWA